MNFTKNRFSGGVTTTVFFKTEQGENTSLRFQKKQGISIYGRCIGSLSLPEPGTLVQLNVRDSGGNLLYSNETHAGVFGGYDFYFVTPDKDETLEIEIIANYSIAGKDDIKTTISVGESSMPVPPSPVPDVTASIMPYVLIAGVILAGLFYFKSVKR